MRKANLSILGLYIYDNTIFDEMSLPPAVDKSDVVNNIVLECAEMESVYPSADFIKTAIKIWSKTNLPVWVKLEETLHYKYDPIANYDRTEEWEDTDNATVDITGSVNSTALENGNSESSNTESVAGYNSENMVDNQKAVANGNSTLNRTISDESVNKTVNSRINKHSARMFGNIGVTTTQEMIEAQRKVVEFNLISRITEDFKQRFCILVY